LPNNNNGGRAGGEAMFWGESANGEESVMSKLDVLERELLMADTAPYAKQFLTPDATSSQHGAAPYGGGGRSHFAHASGNISSIKDYVRGGGSGGGSGGEGRDAADAMRRNGNSSYMPTPSALGKGGGGGGNGAHGGAMLYTEREVTAMLQNGLSLLETRDGMCVCVSPRKIGSKTVYWALSF